MAKLVADQKILRGTVGNTEESLGKTHENHTFLGGQVVLVQERLQAAALSVPPPNVRHVTLSAKHGKFPRTGLERRAGQKGRDEINLVRQRESMKLFAGERGRCAEKHRPIARTDAGTGGCCAHLSSLPREAFAESIPKRAR
jgi:hypothetical protein